jgi:Flp pilus assembly protein TadG
MVFIALLLAFVLFGFLGFAVDLGRFYLIRGELHVAAESMALAAGRELIGTNAAQERAQAAVDLTQATGSDNRFNFGGNAIGGEGGLLASEIRDLEVYSTYNDAVAGEEGATSAPAEARYVRVRVRADAPLTFWQFLPVGTAGITSIETAAVAGVSLPVCSACGIEPLAVTPLNVDDTTDFGFVRGVKYTLHSQCPGPPPAALQGTAGVAPYTILNRTLEDASDQDQQVFKLLAGGIPAPAFPVSEESTLACPTIGSTETRLGALSVAACNSPNRGTIPRDALCGLNSRLNAAPHPFCEPITDVATLIESFPADTNIDSIDDYGEYTGNRRRILTVTVVDALPFAAGTSMNVLGFRQFLLEPNPDSTELSPTDPVGRFVAMYIGYPAPLRQGDFGTCGVTQGPGKVVLH